MAVLADIVIRRSPEFGKLGVKPTWHAIPVADSIHAYASDSMIDIWIFTSAGAQGGNRTPNTLVLNQLPLPNWDTWA